MITDEDIQAFEEANSYYTDKGFIKSSIPSLVMSFMRKAQQKPDKNLYFRLILEESDEWFKAESQAEELKELADLVYVIYGYAISNGWDLDEAIRRVHNNNMGRMTQPDGTIRRRMDGKIEKNPHYPKVDLSDLLGE